MKKSRRGFAGRVEWGWIPALSLARHLALPLASAPSTSFSECMSTSFSEFMSTSFSEENERRACKVRAMEVLRASSLQSASYGSAERRACKVRAMEVPERRACKVRAIGGWVPRAFEMARPLRTPEAPKPRGTRSDGASYRWVGRTPPQLPGLLPLKLRLYKFGSLQEEATPIKFLYSKSARLSLLNSGWME